MTIKEYWDMVNNIQVIDNQVKIREKCNAIEKMLKADNNIDNDAFEDLMMTITFIYRESYKRG